MPAKTPPKPRQTRKYPTLEAWISNDINQDRLKELVTDEVFLAACHYVAKRFEVTPEAIKVESAELLARKTAMHTVASQFPDLLVGLIKRPARATEIQPWDHINPQ